MRVENPREREREREMEEELFASKPRSYRMDRKSAEAIKLRDAVNRKLFDFLGNYTDDVLAEYIVVLVCNGKSQNQARNDLEAFLGEDSGTFITWLWNHLAKENYISRTPDASNLKADMTSSYDILNKEQKSGTLPSLRTPSTRKSDILLPKSGMYDRPYCSTNSDGSNITEIPESLQRWCPSMNGNFTEGKNERLKDHLNEVSPKRLANEHPGAANRTGATKQFSSIVRCAAENLTDDEQLYNQYQDQKIPETDSSALLHQPLPSPRTEQPRRGLRSTLAEDHQPRPLHVRNSAKIRLQSAAVDSVRHQITRPRGNVWDRLGKACNEDDAEMREKSNLHNTNLSRRDLPDSQAEENQNSRSMWIKQNARLSSNLVRESVGTDNSCHKAMFEDSPNKCRKLESSPNSRRKRLYSEFISGNSSASSVCKENHVKIKEVPPKSFQVNYNRSLSKLPSEAKRSTTLVSVSAHSSVIRARVQHDSQAIKVDPVISAASVARNTQTDNASSPQINKSASVTRQAKKPVPKNIQLPSNSESPSKAECPTANCKPIKDEEQDVNAKLRQMETKLVELRKQAALTGVQNHSEEDLESRTVLVTNVHFAAQREALLAHFMKCGTVAKVVMLTDTVTAQPKGAAYIVFANKDSVDKAVSMSGTSFFSRILKVMRKTDVPPDFLVPSQSSAKLMQSYYPQPPWKGSGHYTSTHLQWRRENPANRESPTPASSNGLASSATKG